MAHRSVSHYRTITSFTTITVCEIIVGNRQCDWAYLGSQFDTNDVHHSNLVSLLEFIGAEFSTIIEDKMPGVVPRCPSRDDITKHTVFTYTISREWILSLEDYQLFDYLEAVRSVFWDNDAIVECYNHLKEYARIKRNP